MLGVLQFGTFSSSFLSESGVFPPRDFLENTCNPFFMLFICSPTWLRSFCFSLHPVFHWPLNSLYVFLVITLFCHFERLCFVCIAWFCLCIFRISLHSYFLVYFCKLHCKTCPTVVFSYFCIRVYFTFISDLTCKGSFFKCPSRHISHPSFVYLLMFLCEIPILSLTSFGPA